MKQLPLARKALPQRGKAKHLGMGFGRLVNGILLGTGPQLRLK